VSYRAHISMLTDGQGMSEAKVEKVKEAAHNILVTVLSSHIVFVCLLLQGSSFATVRALSPPLPIFADCVRQGLEMQDKRKKVLVMSTGSKAVDAILGGTVCGTVQTVND
jgi:hypothetical protein